MLNIAQDGSLQLDINDFVGKSVAVLGISGSGKSNTVAVLSEEFLACGLPLTIVDPEGEFFGLKQKYEVLVVGQSENVDILAGVQDAAALAQFSIDHNLSMILDLSNFENADRDEFLSAYFERLWAVGFHLKKPYQIVLDEAHQVIPQMENTPLKNIITKIALRGRKRGIGIVSVSQRAAMVDKNILTQASILFLHRTVYPNDLKIYREIVPMEGKETNEAARNLQPGQAIVMANYAVGVCQVRERHTYHGGSTPTFGGDNGHARPEFQKIDTALLETLQEMMGQPEREAEALLDERANLAQRLADVTHQRDELQATVEELRARENRPHVAVRLKAPDWEQERASLLNQVAELQRTVDELEKPASPKIQLPMPTVETDNLKPNIVKRMITKQQRQFDDLLQKILALRSSDRDVLLWFMTLEDSGDQNFYDVPTIAKHIGQRVSTMMSAPPVALSRLGMLQRKTRREDRAFVYKAQIHSHLAQEFPNLDIGLLRQLIQQEILKKASTKP